MDFSAYRSIVAILKRFGVRLFAAMLLLLAPGLAAAEPLRVVALGDSLTAGLGLPIEQAMPARLQAALKAIGLDVVVENAGVSGDTSADGLARLDWSVADGTAAVLLELGANDMLRGMDPAATRRSLEAILDRLAERKIPVMLLGMRAAPNLGPEYREAFDGLFGEIAAARGVQLYPFFLDGVAGNAALNQQDGIHPNARGVETIVEKLAPAVAEFLRGLPARG